MTVTIQPTHDRVLVRLRDLPDKTGSIVRVQTRQEYAREADVLAVGPECRDVQAGQVVLVSALAGQKIGEDLLVPESAILGFVE